MVDIRMSSYDLESTQYTTIASLYGLWLNFIFCRVQSLSTVFPDHTLVNLTLTFEV